jgi:hypothetical protein
VDEIAVVVREDSIVNALISTSLVVDDPENGVLLYTLSGSDIFKMGIGANIAIAKAGILNYESQNLRDFKLIMSVKDDRGATDSVILSITTSDGNDNPKLKPQHPVLVVPENSAQGTKLQPALSIEDEDVGDTAFTCSVTEVWEVLALEEAGSQSQLVNLATARSPLTGLWTSGVKVRVEWGSGWSQYIEFVPASDIFAVPTSSTQLVPLNTPMTNSATLDKLQSLENTGYKFCIAANSMTGTTRWGIVTGVVETTTGCTRTLNRGRGLFYPAASQGGGFTGPVDYTASKTGITEEGVRISVLNTTGLFGCVASAAQTTSPWLLPSRLPGAMTNRCGFHRVP